MFKHILVPLDGSHRAEQALPLAASLAHRTGCTISLLRAVWLELGESPSFYGHNTELAEDVRTAMVQEATEYLEHITQSKLLTGITLRTHVVSDAPAQAILICAQSENADLIVLCSHGYSGLTRWALGSVAQSVARHSSIPVLVVRESETEHSLIHPETLQGVRALVAVDGSPFAEAAIIPAAQIVSALSTEGTPGEIHLLKVVKPPSDPEERRYLAYDINMRQFQLDETEGYLRILKEKLTQDFASEEHLKVTCSFVEESDIAMTLITTAEGGARTEGQFAEGYDLIAIATHGRGGVKRLLLGSIAERMLEKSRLPLLIVRPEEAEIPAHR